MASSCDKTDISLYEEEGDELVERVENFKYLGRTLDQIEDNKLLFWKTTMRARSVWGSLGVIIRYEEADPKVS